jgi:aryl-alcohol dehydrogenase-like predicted oxidoreductase
VSLGEFEGDHDDAAEPDPLDIVPEMSDLSRRVLGSSELSISPVGVGTAPMGSTPDWSIYWGGQDEGDAVRAIHAAIDEGVNWIDTAPFYGWGRAEEIVGLAIRDRRARVFVFTKCGTMNDGAGGDFMDLSPAAIRGDVEASLRRLGTDRVDVLQLHDPDPRVPIEESWMEVQRLISEGMVRYAGLSNHPVELIERAVAVGSVVSAQHRYNLFTRDIERDVLPFCRGRGIGVLSWSSLGEGLLSDDFQIERLEANDFRRSSPNFQEPRFSRIRELVAQLSSIASAAGRSVSDLAIAWLLTQGVTGAIVGVRTEEEARQLADAARWTPSEEVLRRVDAALVRFERSAGERAPG